MTILADDLRYTYICEFTLFENAHMFLKSECNLFFKCNLK